MQDDINYRNQEIMDAEAYNDYCVWFDDDYETEEFVLI